MVDLNILEEKVKDFRSSIEVCLPTNLNPEHRSACFLGALLNAVVKQPLKHDIEICALLRLLSEVLKKVSKGLVRMKSENILNLIQLPKTKEPYFEQAAFYAVDCYHMLFSASDESKLTLPVFKKAMEILVGLAMGIYPKLQSHAQRTLHYLLSHPPTEDSPHPHLNNVACCIEKVLRNHPQKKNALSLLESIFKYLTRTHVEAFLDLLCPLSTSLSHPSIPRFFSLALRQHSEGWPSDRVASLVDVLMRLKPKLSDVPGMAVWVEAFGKCCVHVLATQAAALPQDLGTLVETHVFPLFESKQTQVLDAATTTLSKLLQRSLPDTLIQASYVRDVDQSMDAASHSSVLQRLTDAFEHRFQLVYAHAWGHLLRGLEVFVQRIAVRAEFYLRHHLVHLEKLWKQPGFPCPVEYEQFLHTAFRYMGPKAVLSILPLNIEHLRNPHLELRSYLLNIMEKSVQQTELEYFFSYLVPLSESILSERRLILTATDAAKELETLYHQIWSLLPCFCIFPTDLKEVMPVLSLKLKSVFQEQPPLRPLLARAFCNLIQKNQHLVQTATVPTCPPPYPVETAHAYLQLLSVASREFLPVFFNSYADLTPVLRAPFAATIRAFVSIAELDTVDLLYKQVLQLMLKQQPMAVQQVLLELAILLVPKLPTKESLEPLVTIAYQAAPVKEFQKKAFKLLYTMLEVPLCQAYFNDNLQTLHQNLPLTSSQSLHANAKRNLFLLLQRAVETLHFDAIIPQLLPMVVWGLKDENSKCRAAASSLLHQCIVKLQHQSMDRVSALVSQLLQGLTSADPVGVSAIITTLSRICYTTGPDLPETQLHSVVQAVGACVEHAHKSTSASILGFLRVLCHTLPIEALHGFLPAIVHTLARMADLRAAGVHTPIRRLFRLLIGLFDFDLVQKLTPDNQQKLVKNLAKRIERAQRKPVHGPLPASRAKSRTAFQSIDDILYGDMLTDSEKEEEEEDEAGEMDDALAYTYSKEPLLKGCLSDDSDNPLDLLDSKGHSQQTNSFASSRRDQKPYAKARQKLQSSFRMSQDGKIIVEEDENASEDSDLAFEEGEGVDDDMYMESIENPDAVKKSGRKFAFTQSSASFASSSSTAPSTSISASLPVGTETGDRFRSKKGLGDVKRKGQHEPYAYIPLGVKMTGNKTKHRSRDNRTNPQLHRIVHRRIKKHKK